MFYELDAYYRGYGFKDAYEFFKHFVNVLHEDFKFANVKKFDMVFIYNLIYFQIFFLIRNSLK